MRVGKVLLRNLGDCYPCFVEKSAGRIAYDERHMQPCHVSAKVVKGGDDGCFQGEAGREAV